MLVLVSLAISVTPVSLWPLVTVELPSCSFMVSSCLGLGAILCN
jgi:hypothetical protein